MSYYQQFKARSAETIANQWNMASANDNDENYDAIEKFIKMIFKIAIYPILFLFLAIFPYIYVTYASFKKLINSYRNNVITV